ncbi:MAG: hypothetical protein JWQ72_2360 [Polaromonas sp.]|nr:hypothetical protein [Polaromonas sp.]
MQKCCHNCQGLGYLVEGTSHAWCAKYRFTHAMAAHACAGFVPSSRPPVSVDTYRPSTDEVLLQVQQEQRKKAP